MKGFVHDLRYAMRQLRRSSGFTAIAVLTLMSGIGANTAIFSVVNAVLLKPLPYKDSSRLVVVWQQNPHRGWFENEVSGANFLDWQKQNHVFTGMAAFESLFLNLTGHSPPQEIAGERVSANFFSLLGIKPLRGRLFLPEEESQDRAAAIVSYSLWQQHYGGDPALVGRQIFLNGKSYPLIGILPPGISDDYLGIEAQQSQVWISGIEPFAEGREFHEYHAIARLRPDVTLTQAQAEMNTMAARIEQQYPESRGWGVALVRMHDQVVEYFRPALLLLLGAVGTVLLIACANVANLLLVRGASRRKEFAIRTAVGACRWQIIRQLLVESLLLSLAGGAMGLGFGAWGSQILVRLSPTAQQTTAGAISTPLGLNGLVLLFTFMVAVATAIVFGLAPAMSASKPHLNHALNESGRSFSASLQRRNLRSALVICEFALALSLLLSAALMIKALAHLHRTAIGFNPNNVLSVKIPLEGSQYQDPGRQIEFFRQFLNRIEALPGVESATVSRGVPMNGWAGWNFVTADNSHPAAGDVPDANYVVVAPHYFRTLQVPLRKGRIFTESDSKAAEPVAIVSESLALRYWPGQDPIGKRLKVSSDAKDKTQPWLTVVGVAGNVRTQGQYAPFIPEIYVPYTQYPWVLSPRNVLVRSRGDPLALVPAIQREVAALDKDVPVSALATMDEIVSGPVQQGRTIMWLLGGFAALALLLAAVGIYSVISYAVSQRTHEIGVRIALGADRDAITGLVLRHGISLSLLGVAAGWLGALGIARLFAALPFQIRWLLLFDVRPADPLMFACVSAVLATVAVLACFIPARRAARVDPIRALRYE
ncbi:MAG: ABC transporter permease [Acidobacteria bacterium]|nr:ABC transporter permease [Acidobacteriota bacterium]